jgi:hypothetical protein
MTDQVVAPIAIGFRAPAGFPVPKIVAGKYDDADFSRAVQAYRLLFPSVSGLAIFKGNEAVGLVPNEVFGLLETRPQHVGLTLNSDTPYGPVLLDLREGPMVVELPPGPLICLAMDVHQRWVADMGLPGPDGGQGGRHVILPPGYDGEVPEGYHANRSDAFRVLIGIRSLPAGGDVKAATELITTVKVHPLRPRPGWRDPRWLDLTGKAQDTSPVSWEDNLAFWQALHEIVETEPTPAVHRNVYGDLSALGIAKGRPFDPDDSMKDLLERAARAGHAQLRAQAFADRRPDRVVWPSRRWEWAALRFENGDFDREDSTDTEARDKWFYQAIGASPAMFRRDPRAGSLYWLGLRDASGSYLDGGQNYRLTVPLPVPARLFWSVTVYDARTRSQVRTEQDRAVLSSLFDFGDIGGARSIDLYFGPTPPAGGGSGRWIQTRPDAGWFTYFRIYGPEPAAFDGSWQLPDFQPETLGEDD